MCGIFGIIMTGSSKKDLEFFRKSVSTLFKLSESRGKEASGFAVSCGNKIKVYKRPLSASDMLRSREYRHVFDDILGLKGNNKNEVIKTTITLIGHSRLVTDGSQESHDNNQPVISNGIVGVHNGIVTNVNELWSKYPTLERKYEIDTEIIFKLLRKFYATGGSLVGAVRSTFENIYGTASIATLFNDLDFMFLATNNGSLYIGTNEDENIILFASEEYILRTAASKPFFSKRFGSFKISKVQPREGYLINIFDFTTKKVSFKKTDENSNILVVSNDSEKEIIDIVPTEDQYRNHGSGYVNALKASSNVSKEMVKEFNYYTSQIKHLKRCKKCLLPETMPFIDFDDEGICNCCNNYKKIELLGRDALEQCVGKYRGKNGRSDCIVAFSGGRDSSYGLHYLKTELGLNLIAYTYDWGMVTDLARRNIARICGKLGIEHILMSADIKKKRANIRKNVLAWLKKPALGMVPLFMAGDKQFFYYVNQLKKQTGVALDIWMPNFYEQTDFKWGFSNINKKKKQDKWNLMGLSDQLRMISYYTWHFITNPKYINSSLLDTMFAFVSYYKLPQEYIFLYKYINWNENEIESTLINEYDWETDPGTKTTWRIGDGTASFYNYIYYTMAGFTENDTFRSNQIREGIITREEALKHVEEENQPRWDSIKWYCDTIGIDFDEAIKAINAASKLYSVE